MAVRSMDVWQWPEFRAFVARLGVPLGLPTVNLAISLPIGIGGDGVVSVSQEFFGRDRGKVATSDGHGGVLFVESK